MKKMFAVLLVFCLAVPCACAERDVSWFVLFFNIYTNLTGAPEVSEDDFQENTTDERADYVFQTESILMIVAQDYTHGMCAATEENAGLFLRMCGALAESLLALNDYSVVDNYNDFYAALLNQYYFASAGNELGESLQKHCIFWIEKSENTLIFFFMVR